MIYLERNQMIRIENQLLTLKQRLEVLVRAGVAVPKTEREALARVLTALGTAINDLENKDSKWKSEHMPRVANP